MAAKKTTAKESRKGEEARTGSSVRSKPFQGTMEFGNEHVLDYMRQLGDLERRSRASRLKFE